MVITAGILTKIKLPHKVEGLYVPWVLRFLHRVCFLAVEAFCFGLMLAQVLTGGLTLCCCFSPSLFRHSTYAHRKANIDYLQFKKYK